MTPYDRDLDKNSANFQPLTPLTFLERSAAVFPDRTAIIHGSLRRSYARVLRPGAPARLGAFEARHRPRRHGRRHDGEHARDARMPLRRADDRRRAQYPQHAPRRRDHRLLARPRRSEGAHHRPRVLEDHEGGARRGESEAARDRLRRPGVRRRRASASARSSTRISSPKATRDSRGRCPTTSGTRSRSTTPRGRPAIRRAWSIITAAPICWRSATSSPAAWASIRSISGRCRCSTATAGASRGRSRSSPGPMSACATCAPTPCTTRSAGTRSRISAARRS